VTVGTAALVLRALVVVSGTVWRRLDFYA